MSTTKRVSASLSPSLLKAHGGPTIFWPDLASCHYTKDVLEWCKANDVDFVSKDLNPPNTLELRPIEKYWAIMKEHLLKRPKILKNVEEMKKALVNMQKTVDSAGAVGYKLNE